MDINRDERLEASTSGGGVASKLKFIFDNCLYNIMVAFTRILSRVHHYCGHWTSSDPPAFFSSFLCRCFGGRIGDVSTLANRTEWWRIPLCLQHGQDPRFVGFDMNVMPAWRKGYTGKGVVVSILDDGIQTNHPDLAQNYVSGPLAAMNYFLCHFVVPRTENRFIIHSIDGPMWLLW